MTDARVRLAPSYRHPKADEWSQPGGPWDVPPLDEALRPADPATEERIGALAGALIQAGVEPGNVVAWQRRNVPYAVLLYRACWRIGAVAAPVHHQAGEADLEAALESLAPSIFIGAHDPLPNDGTPIPRGEIDVPTDSLAAALCTSGSTGRPKVVLHTHRGLAYKARVMAEVHEVGPADRILMPAPLAHISGLLNGVLVPGVSGMGVTLMARWQPEEALAIIERDNVTFMIGPPTFFVGLMDAAGFAPERVASLRLVSCGGAGVSEAFVDRASQLLDCRVKRTYGSTEAPTVTTSSRDDPGERARQTDGRPTGAVELSLASNGELLVRGPELFEGYADPSDTAKAFTEAGWFRTGDLATIDADGWLTVIGRSKDVIIRGGENIAASEVEAVLEAHPDISQAAAVGVPDDRLGEKVCAFVVASRPFTLDDCQTWFAEQGIAKFKWPEVVRQLDALPLLPSGKPDRASLRHSRQQTTVQVSE